MAAERRMKLVAYLKTGPTATHAGGWRHPAAALHDIFDPLRYEQLARTLEDACFDACFFADTFGVPDVYGGTFRTYLERGGQISYLDPMLVLPMMARVTRHLGLGATLSTTFHPPYLLARMLASLDLLSEGRAAWNVVTSATDMEARNFGLDRLPPKEDRYDQADEYLEVLYKLWEGSWEDDAVVRDRESGVFTDPMKVHEIGHDGTYYKVPGIHIAEPSPQRTPVIYQAGASPRGIRFAAGNAESIFVAAPTKERLAATVGKIRDALEAAGRDRYSARIYTLLTIITDATPEAARAKHDEYRRYASHEGALTLMSGWMGVDLSTYSLDDPVGDVESNAIQSALANFQAQEGDTGKEWTIRDIAEAAGIGGLGPRIVGSGEEIADQLQEWVDETDVDGFNLAYAITSGTFEDVVEHVIPVLQARGVYPTEYEPGTLRQKLFGRGDRLPDEHHGARHKVSTGVSAP